MSFLTAPDGTRCSCFTAPTPAPWLVATPHRRQTMSGSDIEWAPYGVRHARQIGTPKTACGLPALTWTNFHGMRFSPGDDRTCPACSRVVATDPTTQADR
jgi:hypothetical protein